MRNRFIWVGFLTLPLAFQTWAADGDYNSPPAERYTLHEEQHFLLSPSISFVNGHLWSNDGREPDRREFNGAELALRAMTDSNKSHTLLIGFDLRQLLAKEAASGTNDVWGTKLGIRLEAAPQRKLFPQFGFTWFFGDVLGAASRGALFHGNTWAFGASLKPGRFRAFAELGFGQYREGSGFIYIGREGARTLATSFVAIGVSAPFEVESLQGDLTHATFF